MKIWPQAFQQSAAFVFETGTDFTTLDGDELITRRNE